MLYRLLITFTSTVFVLTTFKSAGAIPYPRDTEQWYKTEPDYETGDKVAQWTEEMNMNPEELGNYFEGDIMLTDSTTRNGVTDIRRRWPNRIIPYVIRGSFSKDHLNIIQAAINEYHNKTCIRFKKRINENDYVNIVNNRTGCSSAIGRKGGEQLVNFQTPNCLNVNRVGTAIHEFMHAVGFWHEHTREDRDDYVVINFDNILKGHKFNFKKAAKGVTTNYNVRYDYGSVMHYSAYAFANDTNIKTIITKKPPNAQIGQRKGLSTSDIKKIKIMYKC